MRTAIVQRELHANRLRLGQKHVPVTGLGNHQHFLSKESAIGAQDESPSTVYSRESEDMGDCATQGAGMTPKSNCYFQISGAYRLPELNMAKSSAKTPVGSLTASNCRASQCG